MSATSSMNSSAPLTQQDLATLLDVVEQTLNCYLAGKPRPSLTLSDYALSLQQNGACFVTLTVNHQLQGCIGTTQAQRPLVEEAQHKAWASACQDSRFKPLTAQQAKHLDIEVSVLTSPHRLPFNQELAVRDYLEQHRCGVILSDKHSGALFLPQVWEQLPDPKQFLSHLKRKAGWPNNYWSESITVHVFDVQNAKRQYQQNKAH
ncbi:AmmeMemoRadiSam system protein A [Thaumasiovibrio sp. DFM-14]|uniref:AmmeMemoRadiSam system protein A n=1 Tax=Thaumasiovibrio sp. DFM-14 TaxID=3384792 RepID=UPI0039A0C62E